MAEPTKRSTPTKNLDELPRRWDFSGEDIATTVKWFAKAHHRYAMRRIRDTWIDESLEDLEHVLDFIRHATKHRDEPTIDVEQVVDATARMWNLVRCSRFESGREMWMPTFSRYRPPTVLEALRKLGSTIETAPELLGTTRNRIMSGSKIAFFDRMARLARPGAVVYDRTWTCGTDVLRDMCVEALPVRANCLSYSWAVEMLALRHGFTPSECTINLSMDMEHINFAVVVDAWGQRVSLVFDVAWPGEYRFVYISDDGVAVVCASGSAPLLRLTAPEDDVVLDKWGLTPGPLCTRPSALCAFLSATTFMSDDERITSTGHTQNEETMAAVFPLIVSALCQRRACPCECRWADSEQNVCTQYANQDWEYIMNWEGPANDKLVESMHWRSRIMENLVEAIHQFAARNGSHALATAVLWRCGDICSVGRFPDDGEYSEFISRIYAGDHSVSAGIDTTVAHLFDSSRYALHVPDMSRNAADIVFTARRRTVLMRLCTSDKTEYRALKAPKDAVIQRASGGNAAQMDPLGDREESARHLLDLVQHGLLVDVSASTATGVCTVLDMMRQRRIMSIMQMFEDAGICSMRSKIVYEKASPETTEIAERNDAAIRLNIALRLSEPDPELISDAENRARFERNAGPSGLPALSIWRGIELLDYWPTEVLCRLHPYFCCGETEMVGDVKNEEAEAIVHTSTEEEKRRRNETVEATIKAIRADERKHRLRKTECVNCWRRGVVTNMKVGETIYGPFCSVRCADEYYEFVLRRQGPKGMPTLPAQCKIQNK